jgi:hypothetical protein
MAFVVCFALFISFGCVGNDSPGQKIERTTQTYTNHVVDPNMYGNNAYSLLISPNVCQGDRVKIELYDIRGGNGDLQVYILDKDARDKYYYLHKNRETVATFLRENSCFSATAPGLGTVYWTVPNDSQQWDIHIYNPGSVPITYSIRMSVD